LSTGRQTEQGRAERKDLEVGAVDELLVGECEVERNRQGTKHYVACSLWLFSLPSLLLTNNIILFYFLLFILSIIS
jgi:hypothetical protein